MAELLTNWQLETVTGPLTCMAPPYELPVPVLLANLQCRMVRGVVAVVFVKPGPDTPVPAVMVKPSMIALVALLALTTLDTLLPLRIVSLATQSRRANWVLSSVPANPPYTATFGFNRKTLATRAPGRWVPAFTQTWSPPAALYNALVSVVALPQAAPEPVAPLTTNQTRE